MTKRTSNHAEVARIMRKAIKDLGVKSKVRSSDKGSSTSVRITLYDATPAQYEAIKKLSQPYKRGAFNGQTDSYEFEHPKSADSKDLPKVMYIPFSLEYSDDVKQKALNAICDLAKVEPMCLESAPKYIDIEGVSTLTYNLINTVLQGKSTKIDLWGDCSAA